MSTANDKRICAECGWDAGHDGIWRPFVTGGKWICLPCWNKLPRHTELEKKLFAALDAIPCTCLDAYKLRGLSAPDCPRCQWVDEDLLEGHKGQLRQKGPRRDQYKRTEAER